MSEIPEHQDRAIDSAAIEAAISSAASRRLSDVPRGPLRDRLEKSINLLSNYTRGAVAEVVVADLVGGRLVGEGYGSWDVDLDGLRVEVKASGDVQLWVQSRPSTTTFSIARAEGWIEQPDGSYIADSTKIRRNDVYVFCHHRGTCPDVVGEWDFYVCATVRIDNALADAKSVSLSALKSKFELERVAPENLARVITEAAAETTG